MKINEETKGNLGTDFLALLLHSLIGIVIALLLSFMCSAFVLTGKLSASLIPLFSCIFVLVGSFFASFISSRKFGKPILMAFVQCFQFLLILYLIGSILYGRLLPSASPLQIILFCLIGALVGAVASALGKRRKR